MEQALVPEHEGMLLRFLTWDDELKSIETHSFDIYALS